MKSIDPTKLSKSVRDELIRQINNLDLQGFNYKADFDSQCMLAEAAFKQIFLNTDTYENLRNLNDDDREFESLISQSEDGEDFAYSFYIPLASAQGESWAGRLMKGLIPQNDKFYGFDLKHHALLKGPLKYLRKPVEKAFNNFLKYAFNDIKLKPKILKYLTQLVVYGNAPYMLDYNPDLRLVDFMNKNMKNFAIYPAREELSKANFVLRHNILYSDLIRNPEIPKKIIKQIRSQNILVVDQVGYMTAAQETIGRVVPKGYVAATTIFMPSFTCYDDKNQEDVVFQNVLVTVVRNQYTSGEKEPTELKTVIVKMTELDRRADNPLGFSTFGPTLAGTIYYQSKLYQMLPYQAMSNMSTSAAMQALMLSIFPPLKVVNTGDEQENFAYEFSPRAIWPVKSTTDIEVQEVDARLDLYLEVMKFIELSAQKSSGIIGDSAGYSANPSERKTAFQTDVQKETTDSRTDVPPNYLEDTFLAPLVTNYLTTTQQIIKSQVDARMSVFNSYESKSNRKVDPNKKWDLIINGDPETDVQGADLLKQFLVYSSIEEEIQDELEKLSQTNPEIAQQIQSVLNFDLIYKIITERLSNSAIIIEGNNSALRNQQELDSVSTVLTLLKGLKEDPSTGQVFSNKVYNVPELEDLFVKLANIPDIKLLVDAASIQPQQPTAPVPPTPTPGEEAIPSTETPEAPNQPQ